MIIIRQLNKSVIWILRKNINVKITPSKLFGNTHTIFLETLVKANCLQWFISLKMVHFKKWPITFLCKNYWNILNFMKKINFTWNKLMYTWVINVRVYVKLTTHKIETSKNKSILYFNSFHRQWIQNYLYRHSYKNK